MKKAVILFGPPGAGKGTQSELLAERLGLFLFETSRILERKFKEAEKFPDKDRFVEIDGIKYDVMDEKKLWGTGVLNSPPWVSYLVINEIKKLFNQGESIIFSGSPRTLYEAEKVIPVLSELYGKENIRAMMIEISPEVTVFRNTHRKICELMRHSILFSKETENLANCPLDGSKLDKRKNLDDEETIKTRLKEYKERTLPMVDYFSSNGIEVVKINGERSPAEVFADILKTVGEE